jgi:anti-sigma B factor antagonist
MEINLSNEKDAAVMILKGELDYNSCKDFNAKVMDLIDKKIKKIVLQMAAVEHIDSMGLGTITRLWKTADENGLLLLLAEVPVNIQKLIKLVNLDKRIQIFETLNEALK